MDRPQYRTPTGQSPGEPGLEDRFELPPHPPSAPRAAKTVRSRGAWRLRPPSWFDLLDPRQPEAFLAFCSLWCSLQMWIWPNQFAAENPLVTLAVGLRGHEQVWAIFGIVASLLKVGGLASRMSPRWQGLSAGMRASGLFMSIVFWMIVGLSLVLDFPHSITPVALTGLGVAAVFELADRRDPRETWR